MPSSELLAKYADVAIRVGIGLQAGDRLLIQSSVQAVEFTRVLVDRAYAAGAVNVDVLWSDDAVAKSRFETGPLAASEVVSSTTRMRLAAFAEGDKLLYISANDPDAFAGVDPERMATFERINSMAHEPASTAYAKLRRSWSVVAAPTEPWAKRVFPGESGDDAVELLWAAIFRACRADQDDPVAAWRHHLADLGARSAYLTGRNYTGLRYEAPGTDLVFGLPAGTRWAGGSAGGSFVPNLPTEEVFAAPHRLQGNGRLTATKPLSLMGNLVDDFSFEVVDGRIVTAEAGQGQEVLDQLLASDEGSVRFGEVAMVPMSSAVASEGLIWNNTLYDENDGCHIAIGRAYAISVEGGTDMSPDELVEAGLNYSTNHVDFVVGSPELNVYGITETGAEEPIITAGEWGFDA